MAQVLIGTSGWSYPDWRGLFYPDDLPSRRYLDFYARAFPTTEINYSFYHLPRPETYAKWAGQVPGAFVFSVKASRLITHTKRLRGVRTAWGTFAKNARTLGPRLGPILLQLPSSFRCDMKRLEAFLEMVGASASHASPSRLVFEFRHESWFTDHVYRLLEHHRAALCIADSPGYPHHDVLTADFAYLRFHGRTQLFASSYSKHELAVEANVITRYRREGRDVFVYFNNTAGGHAVENALTLTRLVERTPG